MNLIILILLFLAFVCFVLAACGVASRFNLTAAGLAFWVLTQLLPVIARTSAVILALGIGISAIGCEITTKNGSFKFKPTVQDYKAIKELRE